MSGQINRKDRELSDDELMQMTGGSSFVDLENASGSGSFILLYGIRPILLYGIKPILDLLF